MRSVKLLVLGVLGLVFATAAQAANVLETMRADPNLSTFVGMIDKSGTASQLTGAQKVTVLAPTNGAFDNLGASQIRGLEGNQERLRNFVLGHILPGDRTAPVGGGEEHTRLTAKTLAGTTIELEGTGQGAATIDNHVRLVQTDIRADNGRIHKIDHPLGMR